MSNWSQAGQNAARTGLSDESLTLPLTVAWTHPFQPETVDPQVQAIIAGGLVYVGIEQGNLYALDETNGTVASGFPFVADGPITASVAVSGSTVVFSTLKGSLYGVDTSGNQIWKSAVSERGFTTAPLVVGSNVYFTSRDGRVYARRISDGVAVWTRDLGTPLLQTACSDGTRLFVGGMDRKLHAVLLADGTIDWQSTAKWGKGARLYWPVVIGTKVYWRVETRFGLNDPTNRPQGLAVDVFTDPTMQNALNAYDANPSGYDISLHVFNCAGGAEQPTIIHRNEHMTMHGPVCPLALDKDGYGVMPGPHPATDVWQSGWMRVNLTTRKVVAGLVDPGMNGGYHIGYTNPDENEAVSCTANGVVAMHYREDAPLFSGGFYDLGTNLWTELARGMTDKRYIDNSQTHGTNPPSISGGRIYHIAAHELVCWS